jgi:hypothetical protein
VSIHLRVGKRKQPVRKPKEPEKDQKRDRPTGQESKKFWSDLIKHKTHGIFKLFVCQFVCVCFLILGL